jgi:two-component system, cell cycle response regulator
MTAENETFRVLLVEDTPEDAELLQEIVRDIPWPGIELIRVGTLSRALHSCRDGYDLILLDLFLPDSRGIDTFSALRKRVRGIPVVVLTGAEEAALGIEAVRNGAQDYLVKGTLNTENLLRAILCSIERCRYMENVYRVSYVDEMTNLLNRKGFLEVSTRQLRLARREKKKATVLFVDLENMNRINEEFGQETGDQALQDTADILRKTFRDMDVIGRIATDEFAVLALETGPGNPGSLVTRIEDSVSTYRQAHERPYRLSLSVGFAIYDSATNLAIENLLSRADGSQVGSRNGAGH